MDGGARVHYDNFHNGNLGLQCDYQSRYNVWMINEKKVKPKGVIITINILVLGVTIILDFQVI